MRLAVHAYWRIYALCACYSDCMGDDMGGPGSGPRKRIGRPTKLTRELQATMVRLLLAGNYLETAAACCDIAPRTVREWIKRGLRKKRGIYYSFALAVKKAEAEAEQMALARLRRAGKQQWTAEAWYLERKFPAKWGRWDRVQVDESSSVNRAREYIARKDVRDLLDEVSRRIGVAGDAGSDGAAS